MARPLRIVVPDGAYHVTSRGLERRDIVCDDRDRQKWVRMLDIVAVRRGWRILAWVLMNNHFHLYLRTPDGDLSSGMHDLNSGYVNYFNRKHQRCGPLFQGRFKAILVEPGAHEWEVSRYIHLNPVRAGLAKRPEAHAWGSGPVYFGRSPRPAWLSWEEVLSGHGRSLKSAVQAYRAFVLEGLGTHAESPMAGAIASSVLGSEAFVADIRGRLKDREFDREIPAARSLRRSPGVEDVEAAVVRVFGETPDRIRRKHSHFNEARDVALFLCRERTSSKNRDLGRHFGGLGASAVSMALAALRHRIDADKGLAEKVRRCEALLPKNEY